MVGDLEDAEVIKFLDGPAAGSHLTLGRVPQFLRVVIDQAGGVDALDQLDDTIRDGETAYVYHREGEVSEVLVCSRGPSRCRRETWAEYRVYPEQPDQAVLRENEEWQTWAMAENARTLEAPHDH